jgi:hypothetical protein
MRDFRRGIRHDALEGGLFGWIGDRVERCTLAPAFYLAGLSTVSLTWILLVRDRSREELQ